MKTCVRKITLIVIASIILGLLPISAFDSQPKKLIYTAEKAFGKIFKKGINEPIVSNDQFDILASNITIESNEDVYTIILRTVIYQLTVILFPQKQIT